MVRTQIQLTEEQARYLKRLAHEKKISMAELIRRSIDRYLQEQVSPDERKQKLLSVIGMVDSGIDDLGERHDQYLAEIYAETGK